MGKAKFVPNNAGIQAFLKSAEVSACISEYGSRIANNAGEGFESDMRTGKYRVICRVKPVTEKAKREVYKNNALLKALHK